MFYSDRKIYLRQLNFMVYSFPSVALRIGCNIVNIVPISYQERKQFTSVRTST